MTIVMEMGLIHPPVGLNLFVIKHIAPDIKLKDIIWGTLPFIGADDAWRSCCSASFPESPCGCRRTSNECEQSLRPPRRALPQDPAAPCLILPDGRVWTYGDIERASGRIANLIVSLGLKPGDRVAAQVRKAPRRWCSTSPPCVPAWSSCRSTRPTSAMNSNISLATPSPGLFVCRPQMRALADEVAAKADVPHVLELDDDGGGSLIDAATPYADEFATVARKIGDLAAILYTSGTTGRSKGAMLTHGNLAANARTLQPTGTSSRATCCCTCCRSSTCTACSSPATARCSTARRCCSNRSSTPSAPCALLPQATVMMGVPTFYVRLLLEPAFDARSRRRTCACSSPARRRCCTETFDEFRSATGHTILERYGMTEGGMFTSNPYEGERRGGTVGYAPAGHRRCACRPGDTPIPDGRIGAFEVRGANVFVGYWRHAGKDQGGIHRRRLLHHRRHGVVGPDGYVAIIGRAKDLIITGGLNVYPKEIEELIDALPGVAESAVIGLPHPDFGEAVTAVVVRQKDAAGARFDEAGIIAALKADSPTSRCRSASFIVDDLPRNAMGKVQKNLLRQRIRREVVQPVSRPCSILVASSARKTPKARFSCFTGRLCASRAPSGAISMLIATTPTKAGR